MGNTTFIVYGVYVLQVLHIHDMKSIIDKDDIENITKDVFFYCMFSTFLKLINQPAWKIAN